MEARRNAKESDDQVAKAKFWPGENFLRNHIEDVLSWIEFENVIIQTGVDLRLREVNSLEIDSEDNSQNRMNHEEDKVVLLQTIPTAPKLDSTCVLHFSTQKESFAFTKLSTILGLM